MRRTVVAAATLIVAGALVATGSAKSAAGPQAADTSSVTTGQVARSNQTRIRKPALSIANALVQEGSSGTTTLSFALKLSGASSKRVSVHVATKDGTATSPSDYTSASRSVTFRPGQKKKTIAIRVVGDSVYEPDETMALILSAPVNARLSRAQATGTIVNDDVQKPRSGHYTGSTSQGHSISFDVASDVTNISGVVIFVDLSCAGVGISLPNEEMDLPIALALSPDWRVTYSDSYSDPEGSISVKFDGALSPTGPASGSFRFDLSVNTDFGTVSCSTGDVSWSASPPA
jgi:Calx-beta domain